MVARIQRESCGWKSSWTQRLTRHFFSWTIFTTYACEKCGFGWWWTQCLYSLYQRPKLSDLSEDQNYKGPVQKTHWQSRTSCRKIWLFGYSRSQNWQRRMWISKQSSIRCSGAGLGHPMDPVVSVQNKNFRKRRRACKSSWSQIGGLKSFTLSIPWNLAKLVKIFLGNIVRQPPRRSETNGIAERAVRRVKGGTSAVLFQSGFNESWWADSMECYTYLQNVTDLLSDGKNSIWETLQRTFQRTNYPVWFIGWVSSYYCERPVKNPSIWKERLTWIVPRIRSKRGADIEELETMHASEIYSKRLNAKEVIFPKEKGEFIFPIADGRMNTLGGDQDVRTSTLIRQRPIQGESNLDFLWESEGSPPPPQDSFSDAGEAINDFWSISGNFIYRHHVEPRVKLYSPREESFPIPLKYIDGSRTAHTNLDVMRESRIDDYWNIDGWRDLSDFWTGFTQFTLLSEKPPEGHMWSGTRLTERQATSRPDHLWPEFSEKMGKKCWAEGESWMVKWKPMLDNARRLRGIYFTDPEDKEFKETTRNARKKLETPMAPAMLF